MTAAATTGQGDAGRLDFETAKRLAQSNRVEDRCRVAASDTRPELLYFLTSDQAAEVRGTVAANTATPRQADALLAGDRDPNVRTVLAGKIAQLLPNLPRGELGEIERMTISILETLARDQAIEVRRVLSDTLKDLPEAPRSVINALARDVELTVAAPVLRHSPILSDEDLLEIIIAGPVKGAMAAIAERGGIGAAVSEAIVAVDDTEAVTALLSNPSAQIREETLDRIVDRAPSREVWHPPLVRRPRLPARAAVRLAQFVSESLVTELSARRDLPPDVLQEIGTAVRQRLQTQVPVVPLGMDEVLEGDEEAGAGGKGEKKKPRESGEKRARQLQKELKKERKPMEPALDEALLAGDRDLVVGGLAVLTGHPVVLVERIIASRSGRAVTSLVWSAGLSMRFAHKIQLRVAQIPPQKALNPKNGADYPMSETDMRWQMELFTDSTI